VKSAIQLMYAVVHIIYRAQTGLSSLHVKMYIVISYLWLLTQTGCRSPSMCRTRSHTHL